MTKEQERARARRRQQKLDAREAQRAKEAARNRQVAVVVAAVLVVVALFVVLANVMGGSDTETAGGATPSASASAAPSASVAGCTPAPAAPKEVTPMTLPDPETAAGKTFEATITTNCGDIVLTLDGAKAPQTVASFVSLAKGDYWADSPCHRLTTAGIFVLQCGDPLGGAGPGPGYTFGIENAPADGSYPKGTLAMARTSDPNSNGGQFFIVYDDTTLPTEGGGYSIFGTVTDGMDIVERIAAAGVAGGAEDGTPAAPISILKVAVTEKKA